MDKQMNLLRNILMIAGAIEICVALVYFATVNKTPTI